MVAQGIDKWHKISPTFDEISTTWTSRMKDITGRRYGRLVVIEFEYKYKNQSFWLCQCDCGKLIVTRINALNMGRTTSCGCYKFEKASESAKARNFKHGLTSETNVECRELFHTWNNMRQRCSNSNRPDYRWYGGKRVKVCPEWSENFKSFYDWACENGWESGLTLDRIDPNGDYCPENCRWTTWQVQQNNTTRNHMVEYQGKSQSLADWCRELNLPYRTIRSRLNLLKWDAIKAFETPIIPRDVSKRRKMMQEDKR